MRCPDAKIILHTERVQQPDVLENFYNQMARYNVPYEIIGLSYYPYFHGNLSVLDKALADTDTEIPRQEHNDSGDGLQL